MSHRNKPSLTMALERGTMQQSLQTEYFHIISLKWYLTFKYMSPYSQYCWNGTSRLSTWVHILSIVAIRSKILQYLKYGNHTPTGERCHFKLILLWTGESLLVHPYGDTIQSNTMHPHAAHRSYSFKFCTFQLNSSRPLLGMEAELANFGNGNEWHLSWSLAATRAMSVIWPPQTAG